jgi:hypothetical protein
MTFLTLWLPLVNYEVLLGLYDSLLWHYVQLNILAGKSFNNDASEVEYAADLYSGLCPADLDVLKIIPDNLHLAFPSLSLGRLIQLPSFIEDCHQDLIRDRLATFCHQLKRGKHPFFLSEEPKHVGVAPKVVATPQRPVVHHQVVQGDRAI